MLNLEACYDLGQEGGDLTGPALSAELVDGGAEHLFAGVAIHPLSGRVPARDHAIEGLGDDGVVRILDDRRQELGVLQRLSVPGHLAHCRDHQQDIPGVKVGQADVDRELSSVLLPTGQLQIQAHKPAHGICEVLFPVLRVDFPQILRHQRLNGLADQFGTVKAEQQLRLLIDKPDHTRLVHPHQRVRHSLQKTLDLTCLRRHLLP